MNEMRLQSNLKFTVILSLGKFKNNLVMLLRKNCGFFLNIFYEKGRITRNLRSEAYSNEWNTNIGI